MWKPTYKDGYEDGYSKALEDKEEEELKDPDNLTLRVTPEEGFWLSILRYNKKVERLEINKTWKLGRLKIHFNWRSKKNLWGRFGGGWNWVLGFEASGCTIAFMLLVCRISFHLERK